MWNSNYCKTFVLLFSKVKFSKMLYLLLIDRWLIVRIFLVFVVRWHRIVTARFWVIHCEGNFGWNSQLADGIRSSLRRIMVCVLCENALIELSFNSAFNSMPYSSGNNISHIVWLLRILFWLLYYLHFYWFMTRFLKYAYFWSNCVFRFVILASLLVFVSYRVVTFCTKLRRVKCFNWIRRISSIPKLRFTCPKRMLTALPL